MSQYNSQEKDEQSGKRTKSSSSNKKKSKQGKLNPKKPFEKVSTYESDNETPDDASSDGSPFSVVAVEQHGLPTSNPMSYADNLFLAKLKNKAILAGVDFCQVMAKNQGVGSKNLKGNDLKRHLAWKECKMIISKLALVGTTLKCMEEFLNSATVHLTNSPEFNDHSAHIVARICNILEQNCHMENVDNSVLSCYFNKRFADIRNRKNYVKK